MPRFIEGVVSDFAQPGDKSDTPELTLGDMEEMTAKLKGMRLTYDHYHPIHSTSKQPIDREITVGKIVDAYIDEDECLRVRAELDEGGAGERTRKEIENKFLTGFSLGLAHQMDLDKGKFKKELVELSITPIPEFAATSFVRFVETGENGTEKEPLHRKLGELKEISKEAKGKVVAITASAGKRDDYTKQRSSEILADLIRRTDAQPLTSAGARKFSNTANDNSQRAASQFHNTEAQRQKMSGQFNMPQGGGDAQIQSHMDGLRARRDEQAEKAIANGNTFRQAMPRNGIAPIHIHNYMDGTRRRAREMQQQQQQQQQQSRGRQGHEQIVQPNNNQDDDGDDYIDEDAGDYYDDMDEIQEQAAPPPRQQQQQRQRRSNSQPARRQQRQSAASIDDDDVPPPAPDVARRRNAPPPPRLIEAKTKTAAEIKRIEKEQRDAFVNAGGKVDDAAGEGGAVNDEFEAYKEFRQLKSGKRKQAQPAQRKQPAQQQTKSKKAAAAAPTSDEYMVLDVDAEDNESDHGDGNDDDTDVLESTEAKLRRENAALRSKMAAKAQVHVNSIKSKMNKQSNAPSAYDDGGDDDVLDAEYASTTAGEFDNEDDMKNNIDMSELNKLLKVDANGNSQAKEEFYERIEDLKEKRKELTALKHRLVDARGDPSKEKLVAKLIKQQKAIEETLQKEKNELVLAVRDFQSSINIVQGQKTDPRQLEMYGKMLAKRGLVTEQDLDVLGAQVIAVSASATSMGKTLASVTERFQRERIEREKLAFQAKEQARLLGNASDSAAAHRMVANNDPVGRANKSHSSATSSTTELPFFIPTKERQPQQATATYAGYDPVTMLPAGKKRGDFTLQEQMGIAFNIADQNKEVKQNTNLEHAWRQKKPNMFSSGIPRDAQLRVKKGVWRTGNTEMMQAISASRAESGVQFAPQQMFNHYSYTRDIPQGAVKSTDGDYFVLPDPFKTGGQ